jgi:hypothetical protein
MARRNDNGSRSHSFLSWDSLRLMFRLRRLAQPRCQNLPGAAQRAKINLAFSV